MTTSKTKSTKSAKSAKSSSGTKPPAPPAMTKADFVRSLPAGTPAAEAVARAKKEGFELTTAHVYAVRSDDKKRSTAKARATGGERFKPASVVLREEGILLAVASVIGLGRAIEILAGEQQRVQEALQKACALEYAGAS